MVPPGTFESGVYFPLSSAAAAVTSLKVDPGGSTSWIARLTVAAAGPGSSLS